MSRAAVSCEHLASAAYLDEVSFPSNPPSRRLMIRRWRSLSAAAAWTSQKRALRSTEGEDGLGAGEGAVQALEEPADPRRDVELAFLRALKALVIGFPLDADLRGHAVETLRASLRTRQRHVGDRTRDASVAILERVDGDEPEMGDGGENDRVDAARCVEPRQEGTHLRWQGARRPAPSKWTCSRPTGPETTCIGPDSAVRQAPTVILAMPLRPVGNSAACQPNRRSCGQRRAIILRRIEHHLDHAFDIAVDEAQERRYPCRAAARSRSEPVRDRAARLRFRWT